MSLRPTMSHGEAGAGAGWRVLPLWLSFAAWSALMAGLGCWNASKDYKAELNAATFVAIDSFYNDLAYRRWAAEQGGVYVPISEETLPNPYLLAVPEREIATPSGRQLTLVNPACMIHQVHDPGNTPYGSRVHLTSLKPVRPENAADAWETQGLRQFEKGDKEAVSLEVLDGAPFLRFMRPLLIETACLKCHASHGFKLGDVRGGVSVSVPWGPFRKNWLGHVVYDSIILAGIWLLVSAVSVGIVLWRRDMQQFMRERERAEDALHESESRYRAMADANPDLMFRLSREGVHIDYRAPASEMLFLKPEEFIDRNVRDTLPPAVADTYMHRIHETLERGGTQLFEYDLTISPQDRRFYEARMARCGTDDVLVIVRDITGRRRAEGALRESEQRYRGLFESSGDAILLMKGDVLVDCNKKALEMFGGPREEITGRTLSDLSPPLQPNGGDSAEKAREQIFAALEGPTQRFEWLHRKKSGGSFLAEVSLSPLKIEGAPHLQAIVHDISERRDLERRLLQAQKMEAIGTLAGGIAHDFNNILSVIVGYTQVALLKIPQEGSVVEYLREVLAAGKRATDLVAQILIFSRKADNKPRPCELGPIVKETLKFLRASLPATIRFFENVSPVAPVIMDPTQIQQMVMNLCTNAFHAMEKRGGLLEVALEEVPVDASGERQTGLAAGRYARLTVSDSGEGIPPEIRDRIFEPYFTTKESGKGTGLGLALVHGIVTNAGGTIKVNSAPGVGTTFQAYLPLAAASGLASGYEPAPDAPRGTERILVVDDEPLVAQVTAEMLELLGYAVTAVTDSAQALERFSSDPDAFDLVITDLTMPKLTGTMLVHELRAVRPDIPIILCTGFSEHLAGERLWDLGIVEMLTKPVPQERLAIAIRRALAGSEPNGSSEGTG